ncbi:D-alanine--D-alanine ligase family protein [Oryzihumus leptocrescens]|uniref:D-alanine--D-alanine ligase n=1 Tax=Oryzihumus leptocrescens TaxID=297536 RepID=A0A542Z7L6_9MICO|nr:D-alanine--D-alanine ligase [Oryzihumus leptocrescens]TQL56335.1 D-alanine-D-alanine ligase [Oryzihumus leptocrescens]
MSHVLVLAGGLSHERDVSLRSGRRVAEALGRAGCEAQVRDVDSGLLETLRSQAPDVVWPVLHGATGEDGALRDVLETLGVRYVGARPASCRLTWDKPVAKALVEQAGVATPAGVALSHATFRELGSTGVLDAVVGSLGLPLAVKPARGGSALGLTIVRSAAELPSAMVAAYAYGDIALIERYVSGTEVAVSIVEDHDGLPQALPAVEIVPDSGVYSYDARYTAGETEFFTPARLSPEASAAASEAALIVYAVLGHRHLSRVDLIVDESGKPWFLEANSSPGMTETSLLPMALEAAGLEAAATYAALVRRAQSD